MSERFIAGKNACHRVGNEWIHLAEGQAQEILEQAGLLQYGPVIRHQKTHVRPVGLKLDVSKCTVKPHVGEVPDNTISRLKFCKKARL